MRIFNFRREPRPAFTLAEIMVVVVAMAVIITGVIIGVGKTRVKARDTQRITDARELLSALETYYYTNKSFPTTITSNLPLQDVGTTYMHEVPDNPSPRTDGYCENKNFRYELINNNRDYQLTFCLGGDAQNYRQGLNICEHGNCVPCGVYVIRDRDGYEYKTVQIGGQCWMAENLKTKTTPSNDEIPSSGRKCIAEGNVAGTEADCEAGYTLYGWSTAMNGSTTEGAQGICPDGWHIPTDGEWYTLESFLADPGQSCSPTRSITGCSTAGTKLKIGGSSSFNALLTGTSGTGPTNFDHRGTADWFMVSKYVDALNAMRRNLGSGAGIGRDPSLSNQVLNAVRCIKNY